MDVFYQIAERKIREAMERGELDNLPNRGQKLDLRPDPYVPAELQMGLKLLKNAGMVPEEVSLNNDITSLRALLDNCLSVAEEIDLKAKIRQKLLMLNFLRERNGRSIALQDYLAKVETNKI